MAVYKSTPLALNACTSSAVVSRKSKSDRQLPNAPAAPARSDLVGVHRVPLLAGWLAGWLPVSFGGGTCELHSDFPDVETLSKDIHVSVTIFAVCSI